jgi:hypothetical protein
MANHNPQLAALKSLTERIPGDGPTSQKVKNALERIARETELVANFKADPMKSDLANTMLQNQERAHLRDAIEKVRSELGALTAAFESEQAASRAAKAQLVKGEFDVETRSLLRSLTPEQRMETINTAFKTGDTKTLAAVLTAPANLSGLTAGQHSHFTQSWLDHAAPRDAEFLPELQNVIGTSLGVAAGFTKPIGGAAIPPVAAPIATA